MSSTDSFWKTEQTIDLRLFWSHFPSEINSAHFMNEILDSETKIEVGWRIRDHILKISDQRNLDFNTLLFLVRSILQVPRMKSWIFVTKSNLMKTFRNLRPNKTLVLWYFIQFSMWGQLSPFQELNSSFMSKSEWMKIM